MEYYDYIQITGLESEYPEGVDNGAFEVLQGQTCTGSTAAAPVVLLPAEESLYAALWQAQSAIIEQESIYLDEIKTMFEGKKSALPKETNLKDKLLDEFLEEVGGTAAYFLTLLISKSRVWASVAEFVVSGLIGVGLEMLREMYTKGNVLCDQLKSENAVLLQVGISRANYELRGRVISLHTEIIQNLLAHIAILESAIDRMTATQDQIDLVDSIKALQYNDEEIDLNDVRIYLRSKIIDYGG